MDNLKETTLDLRFYGLDSKGTMAVAMAMVVCNDITYMINGGVVPKMVK